MTRTLVRIARTIYKATPVPALRHFYFTAFCRVMRARRVRATIQGSTFELDLGEMIDVALYLEQYEPDVSAALERHSAPGMTVLDIGANIGAHTLALARLVTRTGAVYAFEPTDFAFEKLTRNVSLNDVPQIRPIKAALSDHNAERQEIAYRSSWRTSGGRSDRTTRVDLVRLDDWCALNGVSRVGLIKIDIDGNEFPALAGGMQLIERSRPVIVMEAVWPHFADDRRNPFLLLQRRGYRFWDAKSDHEYASIADMARLFPAGDEGMTRSINLIARPSKEKD
jgi:FkbM family methyltransferase